LRTGATVYGVCQFLFGLSAIALGCKGLATAAAVNAQSGGSAGIKGTKLINVYFSKKKN
jgi:hypothetical protein